MAKGKSKIQLLKQVNYSVLFLIKSIYPCYHSIFQTVSGKSFDYSNICPTVSNKSFKAKSSISETSSRKLDQHLIIV